MKTMTKLLALVLAFCLCLSAAAYAAESAGSSYLFTDRDLSGDYDDCMTVTLAEGASAADGAGVTVDGDTVTITAEGKYRLTGTLENGQIRVAAEDGAKVQLVLDGASVTCTGSAALYILSADKVFLTTAAGSQNALTSLGDFAADSENNVDGAIFAACDLTLNGAGSLTVKCEKGHGVVCKDDLKLTGGTVDVSALKDGLNVNDSVRVAGGVLSIAAGSDGIDCSHDDADKGWIYIGGGEITIGCYDDGIHASSELTVAGGVLDVTSYEGLEGMTIAITGGDINLLTTDDGVNAAGSAAAALTISGGVLRVNSNGDSLDANGSLLITGGRIEITGPSNSGNGILDYDLSGAITGGTVIGTGILGMQVNFTQASTQGSILYTLPGLHAAGTEIALKDSAGNVIASFTAEESFQVVLVSAPEIQAGQTYTLTVGDTDYTVEMTSLTYGGGSGFGMGGASGGRGGWGTMGGASGGWTGY